MYEVRLRNSDGEVVLELCTLCEDVQFFGNNRLSFTHNDVMLFTVDIKFIREQHGTLTLWHTPRF